MYYLKIRDKGIKVTSSINIILPERSLIVKHIKKNNGKEPMN